MSLSKLSSKHPLERPGPLTKPLFFGPSTAKAISEKVKIKIPQEILPKVLKLVPN
ncbi:hypothetical protein PRV_00910 [Mycoplasma parvum str. Indiana]|uniref:Uncharacterized protein n=1 Tax=Mycoplasma parvum str. Indiana TaxID=1403316 RepID=U5NC13_9MOLU|nr:hypothetical protein PRV_00910 [Mycoplasma parvum str. Indiana]